MADDDAPTGISLAQQIKCVEREIALRAVAYPAQVRQKRMSDAQANFELAAMRSVLATLKALAAFREWDEK